MDRCNLTITLLPNYAYLPAFFAEHGVEVVASLPHYRQKGTDAQRGDGVFEESIEALRRLNEAGLRQGYGAGADLVTNPVGTFLPGGQAELEREWKRQMLRLYGIEFDRLFTITNMPISRFLEFLEETGQLGTYMERLVTAFNPAAAAGVMCRNTLSVGWDGTLYDCDFNQMLELPVHPGAAHHLRLRPGCAGATGDRGGAALLRLHGGGGVQLRRGDGGNRPSQEVARAQHLCLRRSLVVHPASPRSVCSFASFSEAVCMRKPHHRRILRHPTRARRAPSPHTEEFGCDSPLRCWS
jgi:hypothetical protein